MIKADRNLLLAFLTVFTGILIIIYYFGPLLTRSLGLDPYE